MSSQGSPGLGHRPRAAGGRRHNRRSGLACAQDLQLAHRQPSGAKLARHWGSLGSATACGAAERVLLVRWATRNDGWAEAVTASATRVTVSRSPGVAIGTEGSGLGEQVADNASGHCLSVRPAWRIQVDHADLCPIVRRFKKLQQAWPRTQKQPDSGGMIDDRAQNPGDELGGVGRFIKGIDDHGERAPRREGTGVKG